MTHAQYVEKYHRYLQSEKWNLIRKAVIRRDGGLCRICGGKEQVMQVHHLSYAHVFHEERNLDTLILCCESCHRREHKAQREDRTWPPTIDENHPEVRRHNHEGI